MEVKNFSKMSMKLLLALHSLSSLDLSKSETIGWKLYTWFPSVTHFSWNFKDILIAFFYCLSNQKKKWKTQVIFIIRAFIQFLIKHKCTILLFYKPWLSVSSGSSVQYKQLLMHYNLDIHAAISCCLQKYFSQWRWNLEHCNLHDQSLCWLESNNEQNSVNVSLFY